MGTAELAVIVLARAPVPGAVKRRLIPALGANAAATLHRRMAAQAIETAAAAAVGPVHLWCTPDADHPFFADIAPRFGLETHAQHGADLGARMHHALASALARFPGAVLVGTDCPSLEATDLQAAANHLHAGYDAVLGPAADGGYVLIGLTRVAPALFHGLDWGSARVLGQTRARLSALGWRWRELVVRRDVDRPEDLQYLPDRLLAGLEA